MSLLVMSLLLSECSFVLWGLTREEAVGWRRSFGQYLYHFVTRFRISEFSPEIAIHFF